MGGVRFVLLELREGIESRTQHFLEPKKVPGRPGRKFLASYGELRNLTPIPGISMAKEILHPTFLKSIVPAPISSP